MNSANDVSVRSPESPLVRSNLLQRVLSSLVLLPLLALTVWIGGIWFVVVAAACLLLTLHEVYQLFAHTGYQPRLAGYTFGVLFLLEAALRPLTSVDLTGLTLLIALIGTFLVELPRRQRDGSLLAWALTLSGAIYVGWTMTHFVLLRQIAHPLTSAPLDFLRLEAGAAWIVVAMAITFIGDTAAYFVGRTLGRHHLAPYISPKKTWEGAAGGLVGSVVTALALVPLLGLPVTPFFAALLGTVGSIAGQVGDLAESLIKRQVGIKDSGNLIPGHGGILDRADSLLFTVPILYYLVRWLTT